jgi:hypothetical protein
MMIGEGFEGIPRPGREGLHGKVEIRLDDKSSRSVDADGAQ